MANTFYQKQRKHHIVYKTTNITNGKIYVGCHSTDDLDDGYLGSGDNILRALKKYGVENFKREILQLCENPAEMLLMESSIVTPEFIKRRDVYNIVVGGYGGYNKGTTGLKHMFHPETRERTAVHEAAVDKMIEMGWELGFMTVHQEGKIYVHKDGKKKVIDKSDLEIYIEMGWSKGIVSSSTKNRKWIFHPLTEEYQVCDVSMLDEKLSQGWIKKKWSPIKKGTKQETTTCEHCGKSGGANGMKRWHGDNCKSRIK